MLGTSAYGSGSLGTGFDLTLDQLVAGVLTIFTVAAMLVAGVEIVDAMLVNSISQIQGSILTDIKIED